MSNKGLQNVRGEVLDDESPTPANLGNGHRFINEEPTINIDFESNI